MNRRHINADPIMIQQEIDSAKHGQKGAKTRLLADRLNVSDYQLMHWLRDKRGPVKESPQPQEVRRDLVYMVADIKQESERYGMREAEMPTWRCLELLAECGVAGIEDLTVPSVNRVLREMGYREERSYVRYECEYALQEVQADWSVSKYFRVSDYDETSGQWIFKATSTATDYKDDDKRQRIWLGGIIDSFSRLRYNKALIGTGESAELCLDFLTQFFNRPKDDLAFRHVGWQFRLDNGALDGKLGKTFFNAIDRPYETINVGNKESNGKIERSWQMIWDWEQHIAMQLGEGNTLTMNRYNELLLQECIRQQAMPHPIWKDRKRADVYQKSLQAQNPRPETIDVDARKLAFEVYERTVRSDQCVSINNEPYRVPVMVGEYRTTGKRIRVLINKVGKMVGELVGKFADNFELEPYERRLRGDFTGTPPNTLRQQLDDDHKAGKSITEQLRKGSENLPLRRGIEGDDSRNNASRLAPPDSPIAPNSPFIEDPEAEAFSSKVKAMSYISAQLGRQGLKLEGDLLNHFESLTINEGFNKAAIEAGLQAFIETYINQTGT